MDGLAHLAGQQHDIALAQEVHLLALLAIHSQACRRIRLDRTRVDGEPENEPEHLHAAVYRALRPAGPADVCHESADHRPVEVRHRHVAKHRDHPVPEVALVHLPGLRPCVIVTC